MKHQVGKVGPLRLSQWSGYHSRLTPVKDLVYSRASSAVARLQGVEFTHLVHNMVTGQGGLPA